MAEIRIGVVATPSVEVSVEVPSVVMSVPDPAPVEGTVLGPR